MKKAIRTIMCIFCICFFSVGCTKKEEPKATLTPEQIKENEYTEALGLFEQEQYDQALAVFEELGDYSESQEYIQKCKYQQAIDLYEDGEKEKALEFFQNNSEYENSMYYINIIATEFIEAKDYKIAIDLLEKYIDKDDISKRLFNKIKLKEKYKKYNKNINQNKIDFGSKKQKSVSKCEKYLEKHFYHTWIYQENEKEQVEVDKWTIGGKEYGIAYMLTNEYTDMPVFGYYYFDNPKLVYRITVFESDGLRNPKTGELHKGVYYLGTDERFGKETNQSLNRDEYYNYYTIPYVQYEREMHAYVESLGDWSEPDVVEDTNEDDTSQSNDTVEEALSEKQIFSIATQYLSEACYEVKRDCIIMEPVRTSRLGVVYIATFKVSVPSENSYKYLKIKFSYNAMFETTKFFDAGF